MRPISFRLAAGLSALLCGSCLSFRIPAMAPVEPLLEKIEFCVGVEEGRDSLTPVGIKEEFGADDGRICGLITVRPTPRPLTLRWKWYSPEKKLWRDTGDLPVETRDPPVTSVSAYDQIELMKDGMPKGLWILAVFLDGELAGRRVFIVK